MAAGAGPVTAAGAGTSVAPAKPRETELRRGMGGQPHLTTNAGREHGGDGKEESPGTGTTVVLAQPCVTELRRRTGGRRGPVHERRASNDALRTRPPALLPPSTTATSVFFQSHKHGHVHELGPTASLID